VKEKILYDMRISKAHILLHASMECWVVAEIQSGESRNTDNFLFGRWENYVSISLLEPTMPITTIQLLEGWVYNGPAEVLCSDMISGSSMDQLRSYAAT